MFNSYFDITKGYYDTQTDMIRLMSERDRLVTVVPAGGWALPLWRIWVRQLGWWNPQYMKWKIIQMLETTNQKWWCSTFIHKILLSGNLTWESDIIYTGYSIAMLEQEKYRKTVTTHIYQWNQYGFNINYALHEPLPYPPGQWLVGLFCGW